MSARCRLIGAAAVALLSASAALAQQAPARDANAVPTFGSGSIAGVVVTDGDQPRPVRRAIVTLAGDGLRPSRGVVTDDEGRFVIGNLPAGQFTLTVTRASFVTSMYGAKRPGRPGTPIAVKDGERITGLRVTLWRGAVVAGVIRDEAGAPVQGVPVHALPARPPAPGSLLTLANNGVVTNERGEFRIFGLEPGTYVVSARPASGGQAQIFALRDAAIDALLETLKKRGGSGGAASPVPTDARPFDYAPVYYPGTSSRAQAAPVALKPGDEVTGLDFALQQVTTSVVSGVVLRPDGTPAAGASVQINEDGMSPADAGTGATFSATAGADGTFRIVQVTPGAYQLIARAGAGPPPPTTPGLVTPGPVGPQLWAVAPLTMSGGDVSGLSLTVAPGLTISGRVAFEGTAKAPASLAGIRVGVIPPAMLSLRPGTPLTSIAFVPTVTTRADGAFEIPSVPPGTYRMLINAPSLAGTWWPRSARMGDRDLLDADTVVSGSGQVDVVVTFSDRRAELSGVLQSSTGAPVSDVFILAFSAERQHWGPGARRVRAVRPGVDGRYTVPDLPPGDYLLTAVLDVDENDWNDPAFLERLVDASIRVALADGERRVQDLRVR